MNLNVVLRGQSNAYIFGTVDAGANLKALALDTQRLLGFDGVNDTVTVHFAFEGPGGRNTVNSGTSFLRDWVAPDGAGGWAVQALERGFLDYLGGLSPDLRDDPTAELWFHSEYDSQLPGLTTAEWESGVRFDAALTRAALGQSAATVPYLFVSAHPYFGGDEGHQAIRRGMEDLAADPGFNADIAARILDVDANDDGFFGGGHLSAADQLLVEARASRALAETWAAYAKPGSPMAGAGGDIDDHGPQAVQATVAGANQLLVRFAFDGALHLAALDSDAARGVGWSLRSPAGGEANAVAAAVTGADTLLLTFDHHIPAGAALFYGHGYGRFAGADGSGRGNAVYDEQGMPVWTAATGLAVSAAGAPRSPEVVRLYDAVLDRAPDDGGLVFWTNALRAGHGLDLVADLFVRSPEFQSRYGYLDADAFVDVLYRNVLDREAEPAGRAFWVSGLERGLASREAVVLAFSESPEHAAKLAPLTDGSLI